VCTQLSSSPHAAVTRVSIHRAKELAEGAVKKTVDDDDDDSDKEPEPDAVVTIPTNKVKLLVGKGGETIGFIQKKSKARLQVKKEDDAIFGQANAFGAFLTYHAGPV